MSNCKATKYQHIECLVDVTFTASQDIEVQSNLEPGQFLSSEELWGLNE